MRTFGRIWTFMEMARITEEVMCTDEKRVLCSVTGWCKFPAFGHPRNLFALCRPVIVAIRDPSVPEKKEAYDSIKATIKRRHLDERKESKWG